MYKNQETLWEKKVRPYINSEELTTTWVDWEIDCKDPYNPQQAVLLALLLVFLFCWRPAFDF